MAAKKKRHLAIAAAKMAHRRNASAAAIAAKAWRRRQWRNLGEAKKALAAAAQYGIIERKRRSGKPAAEETKCGINESGRWHHQC